MKKEKTEQAVETGVRITSADEKMRITKVAAVSGLTIYSKKYKKADKRRFILI